METLENLFNVGKRLSVDVDYFFGKILGNCVRDAKNKCDTLLIKIKTNHSVHIQVELIGR